MEPLTTGAVALLLFLRRSKSLYIQALEIVERVFGSDHPDTVKYRRNLENLRARQQQTSEDDS